jgi:hypothetical protein
MRGAAPVSDDGRWLLLTIGHGWQRTEVYVRGLAAAPLRSCPIRPIVNGIYLESDEFRGAGTDLRESDTHRTVRGRSAR